VHWLHVQPVLNGAPVTASTVLGVEILPKRPTMFFDYQPGKRGLLTANVFIYRLLFIAVEKKITF
jgi:hypothetical protein